MIRAHGVGDVARDILLAGLLLPGATAAAQQEAPGAAVYEKWCAGCHGSEGRGDGPAAAFMLPRPRDFTRAQFQIRTTSTGSLPTDEDILRVIDEGMPGTAMPGWKSLLNEAERRDLMAYLKTFSRFFETDRPQPVAFGRAPRPSGDVIAEGRRVYEQIECWKCHGQAGRGDGQSAPTQEDDTGSPIRPADLTESWFFNGGSTVEDIFRRLRTGLDGTPMPSFTDAIDAGVITEEQLWAVAHYVQSLGGEAPAVREVVRAASIAGDLPTTPDDSAWDAVEPFYLPLVGQIIVRPRWFAPTVDGVWVQALHNGAEIAFRLSWSDPSDSPDPAWAGWREAVARVMEPKEDVTTAAPNPAAAATGADAPDPGAGAVPSSGALSVAESPDAIAIWFPREIPSGMERPYFFMGSARDPVYVWHWQSRGTVQEMEARGPGLLTPLPGNGNGLTGTAAFDQGRWRVVLRRPLAAADSTRALTFLPGQPIPMALFAWDGDNTERGTRGSLSTWYFVSLEEPVSGAVYATPLLATLLTAGLGIAVVGRAQRREKQRRQVGASTATGSLNPPLEA